MMKKLPANWNICAHEDTKSVLKDIFGAKNVKVIEKNIEFSKKRY